MERLTNRLRTRGRLIAERTSAGLFVLAAPFVLAMAAMAKDGDPTPNPFLARLAEARSTAKGALDTLVAKVEGDKRTKLTEEEEADFTRLTAEIREHDARRIELLDVEHREQSAAELASGIERAGGGGHPAVVRREPMTYDRGQRASYFCDLAMRDVTGDPDARARLASYRAELDVELPKREARIEAEFNSAIESLSVGDRHAAVEKRAISRVDGAGGEFVPPLWLLDEAAYLARAGRPFAELVRNIPLPGGTDAINIPRITTGTAVAPQTADNAAVNAQDMVTDSVAAPVRTIAGQQDVALQLIEQSPVGFDMIVFADLQADYNAKVDAQMVSGSGAAGQLKGLLSNGGNAVTYTDASPTLAELYPKAADALSQAATARKRVPNVFLLAPRRWFWATAALDSQNRPLVVPTVQGPFNSLAAIRDQVFEGPAGTLLGTPVVLDPNMPINLGVGTNEDRVIATLSTDHILFEGALRSRALPEVLSGTLGVRLQVYAYVAFTAERYPTGTSIISGTGLVTPTF